MFSWVREYLLCSHGFVSTCVLSGSYVLVFSGVCLYLFVLRVIQQLHCSQGMDSSIQQVHMNPLTLTHGTETHNNDGDVGLHE